MMKVGKKLEIILLLQVAYEHVYDGRELDIVYAKQTLKYTQALWGRKVRLITKAKDCKEFAINCNENGELTLTENAH